MKKTLILVCVFTGGFLIQSNNLFAQLGTTAPPTKSPTTAPAAQVPLDAKTQKKVDKARAEIVKDQEKLTKTTASYEKDMDKFETDQSKGKLSPDKISKQKKALEKVEKQIAKLKKNIADHHATIDKYVPAPPKM